MKVFSILIAILVTAWATPVLSQTCPPTNWCSGIYQYDGMGNIRAIGNDTYVYDTAGRLVSGTADVQRTGVMSRQDYGYDAFGNRTTASRALGSVDCLGGCEQSLTIDPATNHITSNGATSGSTTEFPAEGGGKTVRTYGPDGRAVRDVDYGHDHGDAGDPHMHDWDWDKKHPRQPGRTPKPGEIPEPSKSMTIGQQRPDLQTIIGATILSLGGAAIMFMTGGGMTLQPNAAGVVIVPRSGVGPMPTNQSDCLPSSPYCT
jgi:hypothetical protein